MTHPPERPRRAIVTTPDTCGGRPRIDGTRISVETIANWWNDGNSVATILEEYPALTADDVVSAVAYAAVNSHATLTARVAALEGALGRALAKIETLCDGQDEETLAIRTITGDE